MRFTSLLLPVLVLNHVSGLALDMNQVIEHVAREEIQIFARDAPMDQGDFDFAKRHNVNVNDMFKHSVIKRDDGDHVTIWLHKSYVEISEEEQSSLVEDRGAAKGTNAPRGIDLWNGYNRVWPVLRCNKDITSRGATGPNAPFSGGPKAVVAWGPTCYGGWRFRGLNKGAARNLLIAGSNSGGNMRFTITPKSSMSSSYFVYVGCYDVWTMTNRALLNYMKKYDGAERVRAFGGFTCQGPQAFDWAVDNSSERV